MKKINILLFMMIFTIYTTTIFTGCGDDNNSTASDGETPVITLQGDTNIEVPLGTMDIQEYGYSAFDFQDGDLTDKVTRTNNIDWNRAGDYEFTYSVTDSDGNVGRAVRHVKIVNNNSDGIIYQDENGGGGNNGSGNNNYQGYSPVISFNQDTVYLTLGENFRTSQYYNDYRAKDFEDGDLTSQVYIDDSQLNSNSPGSYIVTYSVTDSDGNYIVKDKIVVIQNYYIDYDNGNNGSNGGNSGNGGQYYSELDNFKSWYRNTCGRTFNESLYDPSTRKYNGKIDCSHQGLSSIDLSPLSIFDGIDDLDLSYNNLSYIDFSPIRDIHEMWGLHIDHNTKTLKQQYDTEAERKALFRYFTNIHGGNGNTGGSKAGLYIYFKRHQILKIFFDDSE